jgi:hypothetical protein
MTQPAQAKRGARGVRVYSWPPQPPHDLEVVSVTSVLSNGLPKPFLAPWSAKMVAEFAVEKRTAWLELADDDPRAAIDLLKRAPYRTTSTKADMGTIAHAAIEAYLDGKALTKTQLEGKLREAKVPEKSWRATSGYISGAMEFLHNHEPEVLHSEATVYSRTHSYAGTTDLVARLRVGGSQKVCVVDFKTAKSVYDENGLQLCAYARADFVGLGDGSEVALANVPIEDGLIVRLTPSGSYELAHFALTDDLFDVFLAVQRVALGKETIAAARRPTF